jgi:hypothetical protein
MVSGLKAEHRKKSVCANIFEQSISTQPAALVVGQPLASVNVGVSILLIEIIHAVQNNQGVENWTRTETEREQEHEINFGRQSKQLRALEILHSPS